MREAIAGHGKAHISRRRKAGMACLTRRPTLISSGG